MGTNPLIAAAEATARFASLIELEYNNLEKDHTEWYSGAAAADEGDGGETSGMEPPVLLHEPSPSPASTQLITHLLGANGPIPQIGTTLPILRTIAWSCAALRRAGLGAGGTDGRYSAFMKASEVRCYTMTDVGEEAYEALCTALSTGSDTAKLSPSGALVDVECAVAVREADTTMSLFTGVLEEVYACTSSAGQVEVDEVEDEGVLLEAAREAIERVEPGYLTSRDQLTFVRGEGMMDGEGREGVRERAAESWGGATGRLRGGYSGSAAAVRPHLLKLAAYHRTLPYGPTRGRYGRRHLSCIRVYGYRSRCVSR